MSKIFDICSRLGWRQLNLSKAAEISTGMSRCRWRRVSPDSLPVVMDERIRDLIRFSPLKDLSAEQLVTGRMQKILTKTLMLGYIEDTFLRVSASVEGKLFCPYSFRCCCHFIHQQCNSLLMELGDGRSCWYISAS